MDSLISVIVPVYNSQQYLERCVQSIEDQTYGNLEIILVDDGSSDNSSAICDSLAKKDHRIRVIHKENGGASDARNAGVSAAEGEYITFVDCDDWIHEEMISILANALEKNTVNLAMCGYQVVNYEKFGSEGITSASSQKIYTGKQMLEQILYQKLSNSSWAILLSRELALKIPFPKGQVYGEDLATIYQYFGNVQNAVYIPNKLYFYRNNPYGVTHQLFNIKRLDLIDTVNEILGFVEKNAPELLPAANARKFSAYAQVLQQIPYHMENTNLISKEKELWLFIKEYRWKMMIDRKARMKNRIGAVCTLFGKRVFKGLGRVVLCQPRHT